MWSADFLKLGLLFVCLLTSSADWLEQPGTIRKCVHEDVEFRWSFNENTMVEVTQIFWMFLETGDSLLGWYKNTDSTHVYPMYVHRVGLLPGTNAGIVLKNVSETDTGKYNIEMSGPGIRDVADLQIYSHDDLKPTIQVDNDHVRSGARLDKSNSSTVTISIKTAGDLSADITITIDGIPTHCANHTLCSTVIVFCERGGRCEDNITVSFRADYGICANQKGEIYISRSASSVLTDVPVEKSASPKTIAIITLIVAVILIIVVVVVIRKKIWKRRSPEMEGEEKKYSCYPSVESVEKQDELPGKPEAEPEYQADTQGTGTLLKQTEDGKTDNPIQAHVKKEPNKDEKVKRKGQAKLLAAAKRGNAKSKRGKKTIQKDNDSTADADGQLESDQTPEPVADLPPASRSLTSEITRGTGLLADPDDWVDPPSAVAENLPDEWVNIPSVGPGNQTNVAVVKPQKSKTEAERSDNNPYKGAFYEQEQREEIVPLLFPHGAS